MYHVIHMAYDEINNLLALPPTNTIFQALVNF